MSINKLFAVLDCQPTTPNRLRGEARNGRRAIYVDRSRRPDGDLRDKPGCVPASGCTKGAPWRATRCIGPDGSPVGGAQQRRLSPFSSSQEENRTNSAAILLAQYLSWPENIRWTCPSGRLLGWCPHCLSICPRTRRSTSTRATACARKRAFGNRVEAWPKLAPDRRFGYT